MTDLEQVLLENNLVYVTDSVAGISRNRTENGFLFSDSEGRKIRDKDVLERIRKLALPPAWENVWIAESPSAHLQATGIDVAGRKQYRYHPDWCKSRNDKKYYRLPEFAKSLPLIRMNLRKDIRRKGMDERKVLAISVSLMQKTHIRVGNESYKQLYGTYGLSTLRDKHVKFEQGKLTLSFKGKKGVKHSIALTDKNLARLVKRCRDIPGQELFQYYTPQGERRSIDSGQINRYIKNITCCDFTAKDFRTWAGTMEALRGYSTHEFPDSITARKRVTLAVLDHVASKLGNTRAVCKKYYVFPDLIEQYEAGTLVPFLKALKRETALMAENGLSPDEKVLLRFLKSARKKLATS